MGEYDIDKDLYIKWHEDKTKTIEDMKTTEEIQARINELSTIQFYCKREWAMLHQRYDKIKGRNSIPPWLKEDRDKLVDPEFKVNLDGEPRKKPKEKKPKKDLLKELLDMDMGELTAGLKPKNKNGDKVEGPQSTEDAISQLARALSEPPKPTITYTDEEKKAKADALKEKMRLAKEAKK
jgi:hypothetical protein